MERDVELLCATVVPGANPELDKACAFPLPLPDGCLLADIRDVSPETVSDADVPFDGADYAPEEGIDNGPESDVTPSCPPATGLCLANIWDDVASTCVETITTGATCDDGDACTESDVCSTDGSCAGTTLNCDDGIECTTESCSASDGCVFDGTACPCDEDSDCSDGDACTDDVCDLTVWACAYPIGVGNSCDDLDPCTDNDACGIGGTCVGAAKDCDDGEACTLDSCNGLSGACEHAALPDGTFCETDDACQVEATCDTGVCGSGYLSAFEKVYLSPSPPLERYFDDIVKVPGGYLVASRLASDLQGIEGAHVMTVGLDGAEVSDTALGYTSASAFPTALAVHNDAIYIAYIDSYQPGDWQLSLLDSSGTVSWNAPQTIGTYVWGLASSGGVLASLSRHTGETFLSSHDPGDGLVAWSLPFPGQQPRRLVATASGFAFLTNSKLSVVDAAGSVLGEALFTGFGPKDIAVTPDGFAVVGSRLNNLTTEVEPAVALLGPTGALVEVIVLKMEAGDARAGVWASGNLFVLGSSPVPDNFSAGWLLRYDVSAKQVIWENSLPVTHNHRLFAIDSGVYALGGAFPNGFLSRVTPDGSVSCP